MKPIIQLRNRSGNIIPVPAIQGPPGVNSFLHIKFKSSEDSEELLDTPDAYIGITVTDSNAAPIEASEYKWIYAKGMTGPQGETGIRGSRWNYGTVITGTDTTGTVFPTGISDSLAGDFYCNTETCDVYYCIEGGDADTARWIHICNIRGNQGPIGRPGAVISETEPTDPDIKVWIKPSGSPDPVLLYTEQELTSAQKAQARQNINAALAKKYYELIGVPEIDIDTGEQKYSYNLTMSEPKDWSTNYGNYYINSNNSFVPISDTSAPEWTEGIYYRKDAIVKYTVATNCDFIISSPVSGEMVLVLPNVVDESIDNTIVIHGMCKGAMALNVDLSTFEDVFDIQDNKTDVSEGLFKLTCEFHPLIRCWLVNVEEIGPREYYILPTISPSINRIENI